MCTTCGNKKTLMRYSVQRNMVSNESCKYTFDQIYLKYEELKDTNRIIDIVMLKSALVNYSKNCNRFNTHLDKIM